MRKFQIQLLSDACISSGENFGSLVDEDVCYDAFGFPYIPAKRIKGCLREVGEDLLDWGLGKSSWIEHLFGLNGQKNSGIIITDARLEKVEQKKEQIEVAQRTDLGDLLSQQNILENYTYIRTQTAMENGVAKKNSLRSNRVMKKGLVFDFYCNIDEFCMEEQSFFLCCCKGLWHMGLNRTRGFGHVKIVPCLEGEQVKKSERTKISNTDGEKETKLQRKLEEIKSLLKECEEEEKYILKFDILLKSPMIFPKYSIDNVVTELYIPGSSILGYFAAQYEKKGGTLFGELFLSGNLIFRNGYITDGSNRYMPVPLFLNKEKDQEDSICYNLLCRRNNENNGEKKKLIKIEDSFISFLEKESEPYIKRFDILKVGKSLSYHYKGNIDDDNQVKKELFHFMSIDEKQKFNVQIVGSSYYLKQLCTLFNRDEKIWLGTSKSVQFGQGKIIPESIKCNFIKKQEEIIINKKFIVILKSPLILLDQNTLSYSADSKLFQKELEGYIGACELITSMVKYKSVGGFNVTWKLPKQKVTAFDAGSVFVFSTDKDTIDISFCRRENLGERIQEGFGEIVIYPLEQFSETLEKEKTSTLEIPKKVEIDLLKGSDLKKIVVRLFYNELQKKARKRAKEKFESKHNIEVMTNAEVSRSYLLLKEQDTFEGFIREQLEVKNFDKCRRMFLTMWDIKIEPEEYRIKNDRYTLEERCIEQARQFLEKKKEETSSFQRKETRSLLNPDIDELYNVYLHEFLIQGKLILREKNNRKGV